MSLRITPWGINKTGLRIQPLGTFGTGSAPSGDAASGGGAAATRNLKVGSTVIAGVYLGSSQFTHVYAGSTLIWSQT